MGLGLGLLKGKLGYITSVVFDSLQPHGLYLARLLCPWYSSGQEYWRGLPFPSPENLPNPGPSQNIDYVSKHVIRDYLPLGSLKIE